MRTKRDYINEIQIDSANLDHISKTGKINGSLLISIEKIMDEYKYQKEDDVCLKLPVRFDESALVIRDADGLTILKVMDNFGIYKGNNDKLYAFANEIVERVNRQNIDV